MKNRRFALHIISISAVVFQFFVYQAYAQNYEIVPYSHSSLSERSVQTQRYGCLEPTTSIKLESDVDCIIVNVGGLTINLNQHTVRGGISGNIFDTGFKYDVVIKNGAIIGGIFMDSAIVWLDRVVVKDTEGFAVQINGGKITQSLFTNNDVALDLYWGRLSTLIRDSYFTNNGLAINIAQDEGTDIVRNHFSGNQIAIQIWDEDILGSSNSRIDQNSFYANDVGVFLLASGEANGTAIKNNVFIENRSSGIAMTLPCPLGPGECGGQDTTVYKNVFIRNGYDARYFADVLLDDGITVITSAVPEAATGVWARANDTIANADLGIDALGITDGGQNKALLNGNPLQCVGVDCD